MPINKNALLRYQILDRCFSDRHRYYEIEDLVDKVNEVFLDLYGTTVSLRQIRADITFMRDRVTYNAPIVAYQFDGRRCYYRYEDMNFSIFNNELSTDEVVKLRSTIEMLSRYRGIPANAWLEEVISNLEYRFGVKSNSDNVVAFEQNEQLKGLEFLSDLIDATVAHQPLLIHYRTYADKEKESVLHPYHVKQYNNRWFLFGLEETSHGTRIANRPLDRIVKFKRADLDVKFIPNTEVDFSKHFKDVVGVTIPDDSIQVEKVLLRFDKNRFPYVVSKPIHHSQTTIDEEKYLIQVEVRPNKELEALLLSFGPQVEILQPQWLRRQFSEKVQEYFKIYSSMQIDCTAES